MNCIRKQFCPSARYPVSVEMRWSAILTGSGRALCVGILHYAHEQVLEAYYRLARIWPEDPDRYAGRAGRTASTSATPGTLRALRL